MLLLFHALMIALDLLELAFELLHFALERFASLLKRLDLGLETFVQPFVAHFLFKPFGPLRLFGGALFGLGGPCGVTFGISSEFYVRARFCHFVGFGRFAGLRPHDLDMGALLLRREALDHPFQAVEPFLDGLATHTHLRRAGRGRGGRGSGGAGAPVWRRR